MHPKECTSDQGYIEVQKIRTGEEGSCEAEYARKQHTAIANQYCTNCAEYAATGDSKSVAQLV
jgi:ribosomal protein S26